MYINKLNAFIIAAFCAFLSASVVLANDDLLFNSSSDNKSAIDKNSPGTQFQDSKSFDSKSPSGLGTTYKPGSKSIEELRRQLFQDNPYYSGDQEQYIKIPRYVTRIERKRVVRPRPSREGLIPNWLTLLIFFGVLIYAFFECVHNNSLGRSNRTRTSSIFNRSNASKVVKNSKPVILSKEELVGLKTCIESPQSTSVKAPTSFLDNISGFTRSENKAKFKQEPKHDNFHSAYFGDDLLLGGANMDIDSINAALALKQGADLGNPVAQYYLGWLYEQGKGVRKDLAKAMELYQKAAENGYDKAMLSLGLLYYSNGAPEKAVKWWTEAALQGNDRAQCVLGKCYENGEGVDKNPVRAVELYRKAAAQNLFEAQTCLGLCYINGIGVQKDPAQAVEWWLKAAAHDDPVAQTNLGVCYKNGLGVIKNLDKAMEWFQKAAAQGHANAQFELGMCYIKSSTDPKIVNKGKGLLQKAADQGHDAAKTILEGFEKMDIKDLQLLLNIIFK